MNVVRSARYRARLAWIFGALTIFGTFADPQARAEAPFSIDQSLDFGPVTLSTKTTSPQPTVPISFQKFNPASGQLTQVTWTYSGDIYYPYRAVGGPPYYDGESGEFLPTDGAIFFFNHLVEPRDPTGTTVASHTPSPGQVYVQLADNETTPGYPAYAVWHNHSPFSGSVTWTNPADLALFTGQGSGQLSVFMRVVQGTNFDNGLREFDAFSNGEFTSTLTYMPEPTAPALLATGVLLLAGLALRHRAPRSSP